MEMAKTNFFILTGEPGIGKTTLTKNLTSTLVTKGVKTSGFYTEEVRKNRVREGFDVVTLNGQRGRLARDSILLNHPVEFTVGKYGVLLQEFENIALPSLQQPDDGQLQLLVIDEIGKMELFSNPFKSRVREIFGPSTKSFVLATIPVRKSDALIETIRNHKQAKVWMVTRENRNSLLEEILKEMNSLLIFD